MRKICVLKFQVREQADKGREELERSNPLGLSELLQPDLGI
jgi:hypothetical protein